MLTIWYGGTFDPVHDGHLAIARAAADTFGVPVTRAPPPDPPHRAAPGADAAQRAHMLDLAVAGDPRLRVDRRELERPGPSWTVDTLELLRGELGADAPLALLLGEDSFRSLPDWREWRRLPALAHLIVAGRPSGEAGAALPEALAAESAGRWTTDPVLLAARPAGCLYALRQPLRGDAATAVRGSLGGAAPAWREQVPAAVAAWIDGRGLYRPG